MNYAQYVKSVPQSEPVPDMNMSKNNAGGYVFEIDKWDRLDRFLILGSEGGTYYVGERDLTKGNFKSLDACIKEDAVRVVDRVVEISQRGLAPKNDAALFVLAKVCANKQHVTTRQYALSKISLVARTGTHLFNFMSYVTAMRGWGRSLKRGVGAWYTSRSGKDLAYQLWKYKQRNGWSHRDVLRLAHPKPSDDVRNVLYKKVVSPDAPLEGSHEALDFARAADEAGSTDNVRQAVNLIHAHNLPHECVNKNLLAHKEVWEALAVKMPLGALVRNLGKLSSLGLLDRYSDQSKRVVEKLMNSEHLRFSRIHPISILSALKIYSQGQGFRGKLSWPVNRDIVDSLNDAFYLSMEYVAPTNKRILLALDVSGSMFGTPVAGIGGLDAATASAAMAMITLRTEKKASIKGFTTGLTDLGISKRMMLDSVMAMISNQPFGGTDCSLPMLWATQHRQEFDAFVIYTDSETWAGRIHPFEALRQYREHSGIAAKLIVAGVSSTEFSIANQDDGGMLDVVGFDASAPEIISNFIATATAKD